MKEPAVEVTRIIVAVMGKGSKKDGCDDSWRHKPAAYHMAKGARHASYAFLMYVGLMPSDAEGWRVHMHNAITRLAMASAVLPD